MLGIVVVTGNRENDVRSASSVLNEIGVGGLNIEIATDNEPYLIDLVEKGLRKSNARAYHWRNISEYRPQAKGVERAVGILQLDVDLLDLEKEKQECHLLKPLLELDSLMIPWDQQKVVQHLGHLELLPPTKAKPFEHQIEPLLESEKNVHG